MDHDNLFEMGLLHDIKTPMPSELLRKKYAALQFKCLRLMNHEYVTIRN